MTATDLKKRAIALAEKTKIDSVTPEEVGQLSNDIVEYIENVEINGSSLGIRKTYTSVSAMEADSTAPKDDKGVLLRRGMLVNIYNQEDPDSADNGKVFSFQNPGWAFRGTVDAGYATKEELTELGIIEVKYVQENQPDTGMAKGDLLFRTKDNVFFEYNGSYWVGYTFRGKAFYHGGYIYIVKDSKIYKCVIEDDLSIIFQSIKSNEDKIGNLFTKYKLLDIGYLEGKYINSNGLLADFERAKYTDLIDASNIEALTVKITLKNLCLPIAWYSDNNRESFIADAVVKEISSTEYFSIKPSNAKYYSLSTLGQSLQIEDPKAYSMFIQNAENLISRLEKVESFIYTDNEFSDKINSVELLTNSVKDGGIYVPTDIATHFQRGFINNIIYKSNGEQSDFNLIGLYLDDGGKLVSEGIIDTIELKDEYKSSELGDNVYVIPYDKDVNYIPAVNTFMFTGSGANSPRGFLTTGGTLDSGNKNAEMGFAIEGISKQNSIKQAVENIQNQLAEGGLESPWKGKKIGFLGNSITAYQHYINGLVKLTGCEFVNYGVSGTRIAMINAEDTNTFEQRYISMDDDLDAVVVLGGINDFRVGLDGRNWGELSDGAVPGKYTFYAGLHRLFKGLATKYFGKPVIIMTPMHSYEKNLDTGAFDERGEYKINEDGSITFREYGGKRLKDYVDAIKDVAQFYSLPVIDLYSYSGMCPSLEVQRGTWFSRTDGLHHNAEGGLKVARAMLPYMNNIYQMYYAKEIVE